MAKKIIIIGSGFGGLAASLRMRAKGFDVTLSRKTWRSWWACTCI